MKYNQRESACHLWLVALLGLAFIACDSSSGGDDEMAGETMAGETMAGDQPPMSMGWSVWQTNLPCDDKAAMHWDDDLHGVWGCGKRGDAGLWSTTDGGATWTEQRRITDKVNGFARDASGRLFAAGQFGGAVALIDDSNPELFSLTPLYERSRNSSTSVEQGESIGITSDGQILADSLTGTTAVYFAGMNASGQEWMSTVCTEEGTGVTPIEGTDGSWCELSGVSDLTLTDPSASSGQITNIIVHEDRFYAAGWYIADEGKVRLPTQASGLAPYHMTEVKVQASGTGELIDLSIDGQGTLFTAGTDGDGNTPLVYSCPTSADCYTSAGWTRVEPEFMFLDQYWIDGTSARDGRGIASHGDLTIAVGNFVPNNKGGWAIITRDGGQTWEDLTPTLLAASGAEGRLGMFYNVHVFESGKAIIVGDTSFVFTP